MRNQKATMIPKQIGFLGASAAIIFGGFVTLNVASTITLGALRAASEAKRVKARSTSSLQSYFLPFFFCMLDFYFYFVYLQKKFAMPCGVCKGKGFYICKLCKGNATIEWSPLYDPVFINPCLCPTCEGNRLVTVHFFHSLIFSNVFDSYH